MATHKVEQGPTGRRVAANVAALRADRGMTLAELSALMEKVGRPILPSGLSKIEQGTRRVDTDDLLALALALDVTPNRLLLTPTATMDTAGITATAHTQEVVLWEWATGDRPLLDLQREDPTEIDLDRRRRFRRENRPHVPSPMSMSDLLEHEAVLTPVRKAATTAVEAGVSEEAVTEYVDTALKLRRLADQLKAQDDEEGD